MEDSQVVKKKLVDSHYPIRLKKIIPLSNSVVTAEAKLIIEQQPAVSKATVTKTTQAAEPIIAAAEPITAAAQLSKEENSVPTNKTPTEKGSNKNLLAVLQNKYGEKYKIEEVIDSIPLTMEDLKKCWDDFTLTLETALKHSAASTFKLAQLDIENETHFTITVPASPLSKILRNISTPVTVDVNLRSPIPRMSTPSPELITPVSILPVATVPRPVIVNTSSTGIKNGLSLSRGGNSIYSSTASINSSIFATHFSSPLSAPRAEP